MGYVIAVVSYAIIAVGAMLMILKKSIQRARVAMCILSVPDITQTLMTEFV